MPPQQGDQCIFCQLISNPDQLMLVGETENFYAWLEVNPRAKGHTMVVPKEHVESVVDLDPSVYDEGMRLARKVVEKAEKGLDADGASITVNIDEAGGQMMPHAYIQVFPRYKDDENAGTPTGAIFPQREELKKKIEDIQKNMSSISISYEESKQPHPEALKFKEDDSISGETTEGSGGESSDEENKDKGEDAGSMRRKQGESIEWR
ncbi:MAG: HIT family protein [Candidatus Nanohaloarchaea archaeon]